jgi:quinol monooxygenase YgiN
MQISRRTLLAGGAALTALPCLAGEVMDEGAAKYDMPKAEIILTAMVKAKPGQEEAVREVLVALVEPTRKEPGCLCYNLHQFKSDKTQFMFYEQWASKEALDSHGKTHHMKALGGRLKDKTEKGGGVVFYELLK